LLLLLLLLLLTLESVVLPRATWAATLASKIRIRPREHDGVLTDLYS